MSRFDKLLSELTPAVDKDGWPVLQSAYDRLREINADLLAALEQLNALQCGLVGWHEDARAEAWQKARAAIAKAKGVQ